MPPRTATRATRPTPSTKLPTSSSTATKSKATTSSTKTTKASATSIPIQSRTRTTTSTRSPSTLPIAVNAISEPLRKPSKKVAQVEAPPLTPSSLLELLAEPSLRGVSEKAVKDARLLLLPPAMDRAPWEDGMDLDDDPERIKERKDRKNLVMKVLNASMGSLAIVQKSGWKAGGEAYTEENIRNVAEICKSALSAFRDISKEENDKAAMVEGEKAALNIVGKLVQVQLYGSSWDLLHATHSSLPNLYSHTSLLASSPCLDVLRLPTPNSIPPLDVTLTGLLLAHLSYALQCALHLSPNEIVPLLHGLHTDYGLFLSWAPHFAKAAKAQIKLVCVSLYKTIESLIQSPVSSSIAPAPATLSSPSTRFALRSYALLTLLHGASVDALDLEPGWGIKQAANIASTYHKSEEEADERAVAQQIHEFFVRVQNTTNKDGKGEGDGRAWVPLRTFWVSVVSRARYTEGLDYLARTDGEVSPPSALPVKVGDSQVRREKSEEIGNRITPLQAAAKLSAAAAYIDEVVYERQDVEVVGQLEGYIGALPSWDLIASGGEECEQLQRGADRLRRAVGKVLPSAEGQIAALLKDLLECSLSIYEGLLKNEAIAATDASDILVSAYDALFGLARTTLSTSHSETFKQTFDFFTRAISLSSAPPLQAPAASSSPRVLHARRALSGAIWNAGAKLYQAGRVGDAIPFLERSAKLAEDVFQFWQSQQRGYHAPCAIQRDGEGEWKTFEVQLPGRWSTLGACFGKIGERKKSYEAYLSSFTSYLSLLTPILSTLSSTLPLISTFAQDEVKPLADVVQRLTTMGACDLLLCSKTSLAPMMRECGVPDEVVGAVVEWQAQCLEDGIWKADIKGVVKFLLVEARHAYGVERPIRATRLIVKLLEIAYYEGDQTTAKALAAEVTKLITSKPKKEDASLEHLRTQYQVTLSIWQILHAQQRAASTDEILRHGNEVEAALGSLLESTYAANSTKADNAPEENPAKATTKKGTRAQNGKGNGRCIPVTENFPPAPIKKRGTSRTPKTPVKRRAVPVIEDEQEDTPAFHFASKNGCPGPELFEDSDKFFQLLDMAVSLYGALGQIKLKIKLLEVLVHLTKEAPGATIRDRHARVLIGLAYEYAQLGKMEGAANVYSKALTACNEANVLDETRLLLLLRFAESLAFVGNLERSMELYSEASSLMDTLDWEVKARVTATRVKGRARKLAFTAIAALSFASIQNSRENASAAIGAALRSLRLWTHALDTLKRLHEVTAPVSENPFQMSEMKSALEAISDSGDPTASKRSNGADAFQWSYAHGLVDAQLFLARLFFLRGSARDAEYFAQAAYDFSSSLYAPAMMARGLSMKAELLLCLRQLDITDATLHQLDGLVSQLDADALEIGNSYRLRGQYLQVKDAGEQASEAFSKATSTIKGLDSSLTNLTIVSAQGRRPPSAEGADSPIDVINPGMLASILQRHIWLLRDAEHDHLMGEIERLPPSVETKIEENVLLAKLALHTVYAHLRSNINFGSFVESTIAIPTGLVHTTRRKVVLQDCVSVLTQAEEACWTVLSLTARNGSVTQFREAAMSLASILTFQINLGKSLKQAPYVVSALLDLACSTTLERELLEAIDLKIRDTVTHDDLLWPSMNETGSPAPQKPEPARPTILRFDDTSDDESEGREMLTYWTSVRDRYRARIVDASISSESDINQLPDNWMVVHIAVNEAKDTLFMSRQRPNQTPVAFCVPLARTSRKEDGGINAQLTFDAAVQELKDIMELNAATSKRAASVQSQDREARAAWWGERGALDTRLKELLENMEFCWLGAFKALLAEPKYISEALIASLRGRFESMLKRILNLGDKRNKSKGFRLDDCLLECFASLSPKCKDEELEDLIYFILDLYQYNGLEFSLSDVDIDQAVVDLRVVLEEFSSLARDQTSIIEDHHTFLVLDKNVQAFPWESLPLLRGRSISRVPSLSFLLDRMALARLNGCHTSKSVPCGMPVDSSKVFYSLNSSNDLEKTEGRFASEFKKMHEIGWRGSIGRAPTEMELVSALQSKDLVIYVGHGGAEQYIRGSKIRSLHRCAAAMLWGCSSGAMRDMGDFDRTGTPNNYMVAGCPTLVATLWDVTDRDIDTFAQSTFDKLRLNFDDVKARRTGTSNHTPVSVVSAVATSREVCKLKYMNGAAPVVYGIPFYL